MCGHAGCPWSTVHLMATRKEDREDCGRGVWGKRKTGGKKEVGGEERGKRRRERRKAGSQYFPQEPVPNDITSFHQDLPSKDSATFP